MHEEYFPNLGRALDQAGHIQPLLVLDRPRFDNNLATLAGHSFDQSLRLVVKSLPCLPLLDYAMARLCTRKLMSFHRPFLQQLLERYDDVDILLGKPLPAAAVGKILDDSRPLPPGRLEQVQWLVDSEERLQQYLVLARRHQLRLRINVEINIGMLRGGLDEPAQLAALEQLILDNPESLQLSGLMGYDAHTAKAPKGLLSMDKALADSNRRYAEFLAVLKSNTDELTLNGAGSPTHVLHQGESPLNDISLGSVLVKPSDFELPQLADYQPALWVATPVLKRRAGVSIPFIQPWTRLKSRLQKRDSIFLYGGRWMAKPAWPEGMQPSSLYGFSSNQQMMTIPADSAIAVDDWAFLRPTQSEAVMLQFGPIRVFDGQRISTQWPTLEND